MHGVHPTLTSRRLTVSDPLQDIPSPNGMEDRLGELQGRLHGMTGEEYQSRSTVAGRGRRGILWRSLCLNRRTTGSSRMASQATLLTCQYNVCLHFQTLNLFSRALRHRNDWYNDRYVEEFPRDPGERSPERLPIREPYEDAHSERYRRFIAPQDQREPHTYGPRSDSYRPPFPQQSPWAYHSTSPYPPPEFSPRDTRPRRRGAWPAIRPEYGDRVRFSRERSVSGGSVRNSPIPSPIRTRTNLPDRITYRGPRSASISGSYPSSPTKHQARHSWGYDAPPHSRYSRSRSRSNSFESPGPDPHAIQTSNLDRGRPRDRSADNQEDFRSRSNSFDSREQDRSYNRASRISGPERGYPDDRSVENQEDASVRPYYHRSSSIASSRSSGRNREPTGGLQTQTANRTPSPAREHGPYISFQLCGLLNTITHFSRNRNGARHGIRTQDFKRYSEERASRH